MNNIWQELGDGVFRRRYESLDLNVGVVVGEYGVLLVDTRASPRQARELINDLDRLTRTSVRWVVNTHWHWDHCWGNALFDGERWGHQRCRRTLVERGEEFRLAAAERLGNEHRRDVMEVEIAPPDHTFVERAALDVGGRRVELAFLGLGHTDADIVAVVPDAGVVFAGDLIEEGAPPYFGDSYPLHWPETLMALEAIGAHVFVPGHGDVVQAAFVADQRAALVEVAGLAREGRLDHRSIGELAERGPYPRATMLDALRRASEQLASGTS
jgi:glyoxylase-like metal-dependent hydrolase (beta-lactamase superfamily II)